MSAKQWLTARADMTSPEAYRVIKFAKLGKDFPVTEAAADGLGASKVRVLLGAVNRRTRDAYAEHEAILLAAAAPLTVDQVVELMAEWLLRVDQSGPEPHVPRSNEVSLAPSLGGRWRMFADLDPETGATLRAALQERADMAYRAQHACPEPDSAPVTHTERMGEAFGLLLRDALAWVPGEGEMPAPAFTGIIDIDTIEGRTGKHCRIPGFGPIRGDTARRPACDCRFNRLITDGASAILDAGRTTYTPNRAQRRALVARDGGCGWPGCDIPPGWCDAHHIVFWGDQEGPTDIDQLILLCRRHHRLVHEGHWKIERTLLGGVVVHRPDGTLLPPPVRTFSPQGDADREQAREHTRHRQTHPA